MSSHHTPKNSSRRPAGLLSRQPQRTLGAVLLLGSAAFAPAQTTATSADRLARPETTITLSPFEVREDSDNGYTATSALSGGRTDTPLKLTSAAISVMTSQFLQDIASTDLQTAMTWSTNFVPQLDLSHQVGEGH